LYIKHNYFNNFSIKTPNALAILVATSIDDIRLHRFQSSLEQYLFKAGILIKAFLGQTLFIALLSHALSLFSAIQHL